MSSYPSAPSPDVRKIPEIPVCHQEPGNSINLSQVPRNEALFILLLTAYFPRREFRLFSSVQDLQSCQRRLDSKPRPAGLLPSRRFDEIFPRIDRFIPREAPRA